MQKEVDNETDKEQKRNYGGKEITNYTQQFNIKSLLNNQMLFHRPLYLIIRLWADD
jgi:hypothetical protein